MELPNSPKTVQQNNYPYTQTHKILKTMINPNQTKTVFWLIIGIVVAAAAATGIYFYCKKHKDDVATDPDPAPETPVE